MKHPAVRNPFNCLAAAIRFLTIIPVPGNGEKDGSFFGGALFYFTITGLIIGAGGTLFSYLLTGLLPPLVTAVILTIFLSIVSGFLHLDGLADSFDGLLSARPAHQCLEIMRDSRIGVMGAAAIAALFLLKTATITSIDQQELFVAMLIVPAAGRTSIVAMMSILPYARKNSGLGELFYTGVNRWAVIASFIVLGTVTLLLAPSRFFLIFIILIVTVGIFSWICKTKIGGATGDTLGAICELSEAMILLSFCM